MAWDSKRHIGCMDIGACFTAYTEVERANGHGKRQERLICSFLWLHHNKKPTNQRIKQTNKKNQLEDKLKYPNCIKKK